MKKLLFVVGLSVLSCVVTAAERVLTLEEYRDKMKAAWVGQMVGVSWGLKTEFKYIDRIIPANEVPVWSSDLPKKCAYNNDDLYVEMTFLKTLDDYGLDVSPRQAGIDFANSGYRLWCANAAGRNNLRNSIAPPDSSHPMFNRNVNDIDYHIESDYAGIISPGCPQEVIRLGNLFGRLMNYGDGMWGGQFIGACYAEAFFTKDVNQILDAGLAAIPAQCDYAQMVRDVRAWHKEFPNDWVKCWEKIKATYRHPEMKDCNGYIDVRPNGAAVVLGLLYGNGDIDKSMELAMRCGWDSDCNPSSVGGILMTAHGFKALPKKYTEKLDDTIKFDHTALDTHALVTVCEKLARQIVVKHGGRIEKGADGVERFVIPTKKPVADAFVPSWAAPAPTGARYTYEEMKKIQTGIRLVPPATLKIKDSTVRVQKILDDILPGWTTSKNASDQAAGVCAPTFIDMIKGSDTNRRTVRPIFGILRTHPSAHLQEATLSYKVKVPADGKMKLYFATSNVPGGDFVLRVRVDGTEMIRTTIDSTPGKTEAPHFRTFELSLKPWAGREVLVELGNFANGWACEAALWRNIRFITQ